MMPNYEFSKAQLEVMNASDLKKLADYYGVTAILKKDIIKGILLGQLDSVSNMSEMHLNEPTMSVRLQRIRAMVEGE